MKPVAIEQICKWTIGEIVKHGNVDVIKHITIDSRKANVESLFIPLAGEKHDGHAFISDAAKNNCRTVLIQKGIAIPDNLPGDLTLIKVDDCLVALQMIAKGYRELFSIPVIAVTGSNGKTTTKDMVAGVLQANYHVLKNKGNYNNHIGLPLTLFELNEGHECMVLEMGMSGLGEIKLLSSIAQPDIAFITNIGWAHIEKLGSKEKIAEAKIEIVSGLKKNGTLVINGDDEYMVEQTVRLDMDYNLVKIGVSEGNELKALDVKEQPGSGFSFKTNLTGNEIFTVNHPGKHHIISALFAVWAGKHFKMNSKDIINGLLQFEPSGMRMEHITLSGRLFINDAYNANPDSMKAAIESLKELSAVKKVTVLGDMLELGPYGEICHRDLAESIIDAGIDDVVLLGNLTSFTAAELEAKGYYGKHIHKAQNAKEAAQILKHITTKGDIILVKGSRSMGMEKIIQLFMEGEN